MQSRLLAENLNALEIVAIALIITTSIFFRFFFDELPCPLCLLQRFGLLSIAFGFMLNLRFGFRSSHYGLCIIAALFTAAVSLRQILLHIVPNTGGYGSLFLGLHLYTWTFIIAGFFILSIAILLLLNHQFRNATNVHSVVFQYVTHAIFYVVVFLTFTNIASAFLICGLKKCPDDPQTYQYLSMMNDHLYKTQ